MAMAGNSIRRVKSGTRTPPTGNGGGAGGAPVPCVPAVHLAGFSGADGWMPALLTPESPRVPCRLSEPHSGASPHSLPCVSLRLSEQLRRCDGVGDTGDGVCAGGTWGV